MTMNTVPFQTNSASPAEETRGRAVSLTLLGKLVAFAAAGLAGWLIAWAVHAGWQWWQAPRPEGLTALGAALRQVTDAIQHALYR